MGVEDRYHARYRSGDTPWDIGKPDFNLIEVVTRTTVPAGRALDIGCGTGDNSLWLAQNGFQVVGTDASDIALEKARDKAAAAGAACRFQCVDFLQGDVAGAPFAFAFDRGCFHSFGEAADRRRFARNVAAHLKDAGLWLTLAGNADEDRQGPGPPQRTAADIVLAAEPHFEILDLRSTHFGSKRPDPPRAWRCLMQKRRPKP